MDVKDRPAYSVFVSGVCNLNSVVYVSYLVIGETGNVDVSYIRTYPGGTTLTAGANYGVASYFTT